MFQQHLPLFFFSKGLSSQLCSVGLSVPVVYVAVSQQPSLSAPPCPPLLACPLVLSFLQLCMLLYHSNPPCPPLPARPQACPLVLSFLQLCMLLYHSNPPCSPLLARLSLLAPPCPPLPARPQACPLVLSFPPVVYVAVSQQPSLLTSPCLPLFARPSLLALRFVPQFSLSSSCVCCCITATLLSPVLWSPLSLVASPPRKKIL